MPTIATGRQLRPTYRKLRWKVNFTQGVSRLRNTLVDLLVRPCAQGLAYVLALVLVSASVCDPRSRGWLGACACVGSCAPAPRR